MEFTGERYLPELDGGVRYEHMHRYIFCRSLVKDRVVLDIASGEGYGSRLLAEEASHVYGVDIDTEAIAYASKKYDRANLTFKVGSCDAIPVETASIDVVVSFETIEHHEKHDEMMSEIKRVLRPDGLLVISSPNKYIHQDVNKNVNPFHVKELYEAEFKSLMTAHFKCCHFFEQKLVCGSAIVESGGGDGELVGRTKSGPTLGSKGFIPAIRDPYYFLGVCTDIDGIVTRLKPSLYLEENDNLLFEFISALNEANSVVHGQRKILDEQVIANKSLTEELARANCELARISNLRTIRLLRYIKRLLLR